MVHKAKVFVNTVKCVGEPKLTDFVLKEEELELLKEGEFIAEALFIGIQAGLRAFLDFLPVGTTVHGGQVARVIESKTEEFPVGSVIYGLFGWRSHTLVNPKAFPKYNLFILPELNGLPYSLGTGYLSMPGNSAYFGLLEICQPKAGETLVVTAAAGSVGSLVGQIGKIKGCKVIGFAGSDEKCKWLEDELGFDKAINYKTADFDRALKEAAPQGVDCFFDNVGGELGLAIVSQMNKFGRISLCGSVSDYNSVEVKKLPSPNRQFILNQLSMQGFVVYRWADRWMEGIDQIHQWIKDGKVKYHETITEGFENLPQALIDVLRGKNTGKAVLKV